MIYFVLKSGYWQATESSKNIMLLMCDSNRSLYFLDSKFQRDRGALIASVTHGSREAIVDWIDKITKLIGMLHQI